ncbi:MAG TPA: acyl-CoA dehydrogenase family protein [Dermatophilaceae bacterium]|nr:acyl-CoA dehydrogenase family protein [Dermatophilaceae bacterium]
MTMTEPTAEISHFGGEGLDLQSLTLMIEALNGYIDEALSPELQLDLDHEDRCPEDIVRGMSDPEVLGVQLVFIPDAYGGMGGGAMDAYRVCEAMARKDIGLATAVFATFLGADPIVVAATEEQKQEWLGAIAERGVVFAYGATEPEAGSDLGALTTTATPITDDEGNTTGYRINGRKQWISNGSIADYTTILAATDAGPSWFVVEKGAQGFTSAPPEDKHGLRLSNTAALFLDEVEVPATALIGTEEGKGLWQAQQVFGYTRVMVAAFGLGGGWEALDRAIQYSVNREQGGGPLCEKQGYTHKLIVPNVVQLEASRAFIEDTSTKIDQGLGAGGGMNTEGAIAKYMATVFGNIAANDAIQAHGGYGYTRPYVVEKIKRDVRITEIYEGTSEICEMTIARDRWQLHLKNKFRYHENMAVASEQLHARNPRVGADTAALAARSMNVILEACRLGKLTRNQHILFRLGELIAYAETACVFAQRAAALADGTPYEKTPHRFDAEATATMARIFARQAAQKVAQEGSRWVAGSVPAGDPALAHLANVPAAAVQAAQAGLLDDMNSVADVIYGRAG